MCAMKVVVNIPGETAYDVRIGVGVLDQLGTSLRKVASCAQAKRVLIITDSNVAPLYLRQAKAACVAADYKVNDISVPAGEGTKNAEVLAELWEAMAALKLDRDSIVVALGGGVVGDLAGFAAATYMRGITVVQCPTTLLSMVDSSVGGKTGINLSSGKNLVGNFKQPAFVCADINVLSTLDQREWACGLGEVAKSALIDGDDFFFWMCDNAQALAERQPDVVAQAIAKCVVFKANVVAQDKTESKGVRECLNYGHTLGHAVETLSGFGTYSHGAAVAEGMRFAMDMAVGMLGASPDLAAAQGDLLDSLGLPALPWKADPADMLASMKRDKKTRGGDVRFVLPQDVGDWKLMSVSDDDILKYLTAWADGKSDL